MMNRLPPVSYTHLDVYKRQRNIQAVGWQDIVMNPDNTVNEHFKNSKVLNYCWNTIPEQGGDEVPYKLANAGYPIILCNVGNFYLDMAYCYHVEEPGLRWGGYVDEYCLLYTSRCV